MFRCIATQSNCFRPECVRVFLQVTLCTGWNFVRMHAWSRAILMGGLSKKVRTTLPELRRS